MDCLAIIPARGGSKGIPKKNIIDFNGKPLIEWTITEALKVKEIKKIIVSTDSDEIALIASRIAPGCVVMRPADLAMDKSPTLPVLQYHISNLEKAGQSYESVLTLQPTSPLRKAWHISQALEMLSTNAGADSLVSVQKVPHAMTLEKVMVMKDEFCIPFQDSKLVNRQDSQNYLARNSAIYLAKWDWLKSWSGPAVIGGNTLAQLMDPITSVDIDEPIDLEIASVLASNFIFKSGKWKKKNN